MKWCYFSHVRGVVPIIHTCKRNLYQLFKPQNTRDHRYDEYLQILYTSNIINAILHIYEELVTILHIVRNCYQFFTSVNKLCQFFTGVTNTYQFITHPKLSIINMSNLSTIFKFENLLNLAVLKFHIWQM